MPATFYCMWCDKFVDVAKIKYVAEEAVCDKCHEEHDIERKLRLKWKTP